MIQTFRKRVDIYLIIILLKILFKQNVLYKTFCLNLYMISYFIESHARKVSENDVS